MWGVVKMIKGINPIVLPDYKNNSEIIKNIEYAKDLLQNRPEQDTVDYKVFEVLDDALDLIKDLQSQIAMLVGAQHVLTEIINDMKREE